MGLREFDGETGSTTMQAEIKKCVQCPVCKAWHECDLEGEYRCHCSAAFSVYGPDGEFVPEEKSPGNSYALGG